MGLTGPSSLGLRMHWIAVRLRWSSLQYPRLDRFASPSMLIAPCTRLGCLHRIELVVNRGSGQARLKIGRLRHRAETYIMTHRFEQRLANKWAMLSLLP